jgi:hypothetical protein
MSLIIPLTGGIDGIDGEGGIEIFFNYNTSKV